VHGLFSVITFRAGDLSGRGVTEQQLGHCQQLADLTPLIAKLGFCSDVDLPFWAGFGLLTLTSIIRNVLDDAD
ncbi:hypothetical protein, partial [Klebsiella quasipneumoniae]|uniref:hypothetical protein n=1 Tax=Klebsiella quasipneumoniae TaxID=1463165 RepID=UPI000E681FBA